MKVFLLLMCFSFCGMSSESLNDFKKCEGEESFSELKDSLCTSVKSSFTYQKNVDDKIELFVRKFPSLKTRQGSIWLVAGGPGESGASFYSFIDLYRELFPNFDVFVPDHRGTGASSSICPEESSSSLGGKAIIGQEWETCFSHMYSNRSYVEAFSITNAAKDLRFLINNMSGEGKRFVYGVSYGTQLTLRLVQLDEVKLDGIILDSLVPMQNDKDFGLSKRSQVVDIVGRSLLDKCNELSKCSGLTAQDLTKKLEVLINNTKSSKDFSENLPSTPLPILLGLILDIPHLRNELPNIINSLYKGDSAKLEKAVEAVSIYYKKFDRGYSNFGSSIPLVQVITESENNLRSEMTKSDVVKEAQNLLFTSSLPDHMAQNSMPAYKKDEFYSKLPEHLPKTIILHGTLDPKTIHQAAKIHAAELAKVGEVSFIDVIDAPHFIAFTAPTCFKTYINKFLTGESILQESCQDENVAVDFIKNL